MVWFRCLFDMFGDRTLSGWAKAGWALVLVFLPWIGALIYLIVRGRSMQDRAVNAMAEQQAAQEQYIKQVSAQAANPADQIAPTPASSSTPVPSTRPSSTPSRRRRWPEAGGLGA